MRHGRVKFNPEDDLRRYEPRHVRSDGRIAHKGFCGCGVETSRSVAVGPPGHPENGWECKACGELRLKFQFEKFIKKNV